MENADLKNFAAMIGGVVLFFVVLHLSADMHLYGSAACVASGGGLLVIANLVK